MPGFKNWLGRRILNKKELPTLSKAETAAPPNVKGHSEDIVKEDLLVTATEVGQAPPLGHADSQRPTSHVASQPVQSPNDTIVGLPIPEKTPLEAARADLKVVTELLDIQVRKFQSKMGNMPRFDLDIDEAINPVPSRNDNIPLAARNFQDQINQIMSMHAQKSGMDTGLKWYSKLGSFVAALYPAVRLTLGLTANVAQVMIRFSGYCR